MKALTPRRIALALYALLTPLAFPHALPGGGSVDGGLIFAWAIPAALALGLDELSPRAAARSAFLASMVGHCLVFHWFMVVTVVYGGMAPAIGVLAPIVPALYVSIFTALFAAGWAYFVRSGFVRSGFVKSGSVSSGLASSAGREQRAPLVIALSGAALWVAVDWARGHFLGGFPWATLGYALHLDLPLLAWTRFGGVYVLSFIAALLGLSAALWWRDRDAKAGKALGIVLAGILLAHIVSWGMQGGVAEEAPTIRVAAIQGNIEQGQKWDAGRRRAIFEKYLRLSEEAAAKGATWIVWPETAVPGYLEYDPALRAELAELAGRHDVTFFVGGMGIDLDAETGRPSAYYDSAFVMDPSGQIVERYDKTHLVPFGEFLPLRSVLGRFMQSLATGISTADVTPGKAPRALGIEAGRSEAGDLEVHRVGIPICYELLFPHLVRQFGEQGAGLLLAMTNDAWYGRTGAPHQFLAMTAVRAAESGLYTVRAANTGISAVIEPNGKVTQASALFEDAVVVGDIRVQERGEATFYARFGDGFAALCIGWTGLWGARAFRDRRRARARGEEEDLAE